jgi:4-hydroxybutyrate CoA-transferase
LPKLPLCESAEEAVLGIRSHDRVFIHTAAATPQRLVDAMTARADEFSDVGIYHLHTEGDAPYLRPGMENHFKVNVLFLAENARAAVNQGRADFIPCFLSDVPIMFRRRILPLDVALIQVSPPDKHGYCSLGVSVDATKAAVEVADRVIAQINPNMPRTHGDSLVPCSRFSACFECDDPIHEHRPSPPDKVEARIGEEVAELVEDGATLQMGIGAIPNAVLNCLHHHKDLGVHTEMFSDGLVPLIRNGVVTGKYKRKHPHVIVTGFIMGSRELYDYVDDNPLVRVLDIQYVNDTSIIKLNPKVTSINSAIEVDLSGQVCADSIGTRIYSGVGGQMDFIRGAALSEGGKPIIAIPSQTGRGASKIVPTLKPGAGVVTTRAHVHYIATEFGIADLHGKNLRERAQALIRIAHPNHRESLEKAAFELLDGLRE